ncbi:hypothetical protein WJX84_009408 [Apatococcus fuscideae]|uniref:J domain-containing protein n=1 Tax=Apatococcus fuscideae TaxID=2026836 RepID=A0AAW1T2L9_9CHLO
MTTATIIKNQFEPVTELISACSEDLELYNKAPEKLIGQLVKGPLVSGKLRGKKIKSLENFENEAQRRAYKRQVKRSKRRAANQSFRLWTAGAKCKVWGSAPASSSMKMGWQVKEQPFRESYASPVDDCKLFWRFARGADDKDRVHRAWASWVKQQGFSTSSSEPNRHGQQRERRRNTGAAHGGRASFHQQDPFSWKTGGAAWGSWNQAYQQGFGAHSAGAFDGYHEGYYEVNSSWHTQDQQANTGSHPHTSWGPEQRRHLQQLNLQPSKHIGHDELKEAFRQAALMWHPDRHEDGAKPRAEVQFKQCQMSYLALKRYLAFQK